MNKKRILIYIKDPKGGTGTFVNNLYEILESNGYDVKFISHNKFNLNLKKQRSIGFFIKKQNGFSLYGICISVVNFISLIKEVIFFKPQYIYSLDIYANISSILLKIIFFPKIKLIISTHVNLNEHIYDGRNNIFSQLLYSIIVYLYPKSNLHISPSLELTSYLKLMINNDCFITKTIPYPVNIKEILRLSKKDASSVKSTLVTFSRLNGQKKVDLLIQAVIYLNKINKKHISLQIIGDGEQKKELKNKYETNKEIVFVGWKTNPYSYLAKANVFILITKYEGLPYSILEAMSLGKPVIASDVDYGPREIIRQNKYGLLTKNCKFDIAKTIDKMLIKSNLKYFKNQSILRSKDFDKSILKRRYLSLFTN